MHLGDQKYAVSGHPVTEKQILSYVNNTVKQMRSIMSTN